MPCLPHVFIGSPAPRRGVGECWTIAQTSRLKARTSREKAILFVVRVYETLFLFEGNRRRRVLSTGKADRRNIEVSMAFAPLIAFCNRV